MEVDLNPSSPSPSSSGSNRSSPYRVVASPSAPTFASASSSSTALGPWTNTRKRRRSSTGGHASGLYNSGFLEGSHDDQHQRDSKRQVPGAGLPGSPIVDERHHFRSLGSAYDADGMGLEGDYGVDSPMQTLTLASLDTCEDLCDDEAIALRRHEDDIDMEQGDRSHHRVHANPATTSTFIPRQVSRNLRASHIPARPSPLARSNVLESGNSSPSSASNSPRQRRSPSSSPGRNVGSPASSGTGEASSKLTQMSIPARTPSPLPYDAVPGRAAAQLNPSPGLSQREFPGAKQMLKYTMGFREDCELCRSRTPGHYGHLVSRN
ncbi:hypothetical protein FA10DRAFT_265099 [Acaromyces ingoldii]|uniref:Uncharacterized protein n=1 Tax=Acaromyces ingoldii TaxID=215250 RepID=A0A316YRD1_9BASI|nr:hypothetical protein FA10DRAFT_265099 [Acaromyces ingoldii]PWN91228.1 hypothetical protein FA10DRAFT_265099 [Acaromyces ingoldii]